MQRDHLLVWIPPDEMARIGRQGFRRFPVAGSFIRDRRNPSLGQGRRGEVKGPAARAPGQIISLPQGGGALCGMGEKFAPDLQTGTGNFTVPIAVPVGRRGLEPKLDLAYSTGSGNGFFGLGWNVTLPGVSRRTSRGVPTYDDRQLAVVHADIAALKAATHRHGATTNDAILAAMAGALHRVLTARGGSAAPCSCPSGPPAI